MKVVDLSILQSIVCQLIENRIDQQLCDTTIDPPNCATSTQNLFMFPQEVIFAIGPLKIDRHELLLLYVESSHTF